MKPLAHRTQKLSQSSIRAVTLLLKETGGINLGQGICDMPTPEPIKRGAHAAIDGDESIYSYYGGIDKLRQSLLKKAIDYNRIPLTSTEEIMVTVGSTGAFVATILTLLDPGDEVVVFEPYYGYHVNLLQALGSKLKFIPSSAPDGKIDFEAVEAAISDKTKAIIVNTPGNPSGKVWSKDELERILDIMQRHEIFAITDEIYEYMLYDGREHISLASLPGAFERTITLSGFSKTYNMTGWRLGYAMGPQHIIDKMGLLADLIYICAPTPLQHGVAEAFEMDSDYFPEMAREYAERRNLLCTTLEEIGFEFSWPEGSYYVLANFEKLSVTMDGFADDEEALRTLVHRAKVGTVAGRAFFSDPNAGMYYLRFCFAKDIEVLRTACNSLKTAFLTETTTI